MLYSWLLNSIYLFVAIPWFAYRWLWLRKDRTGFAQRLLGRLPKTEKDVRTIWIHAVSVGEVIQLKPILAGLKDRYPGYRILLTTTTATGREVALKKYPEATIAQFPFDFSWAVHAALERTQPEVLILVELELWPNLLMAAQSRKIPVILINARLSQRSFQGYSKFRGLLKRPLRAIHRVASQNQLYAERLSELGIAPEKISVTGSIKFDGIVGDRKNPQTNSMRSLMRIREKDVVFIAGSTQDPEEMMAARIYKSLKERYPNLRLIVVPRHPERFEEVYSKLSSLGLDLIKRSRLTGQEIDPSTVILIDTIGELSSVWGLADLAFVGGSLSRRGGQNMIEPAAYGAALCFGPNTQNFRDVVSQLIEANAARVVHSELEFSDQIEHWLIHHEEAKQMGLLARDLVLNQQGAAAQTLDLIAETLEERAGRFKVRSIAPPGKEPTTYRKAV